MDEQGQDRPESSSSAAGAARQLVAWERLLAGIVGFGLASCGGFIVIDIGTGKQLSGVVFLVFGAAFLLMAIQGTPLVKVESGKHRIEMASTTRVLEAASQKRNPVEAQAVLEGAMLANPAIAPRLQGGQYQHAVGAAVVRATGGFLPQFEVLEDGMVDLIWRAGDASPVGFVSIYREAGSMDQAEAFNLVHEARTRWGGNPLVLVTDASFTFDVPPSTQHVLAYLQAHSDPSLGAVADPFIFSRLEFVQWRDERDDDALRKAVARLKATDSVDR